MRRRRLSSRVALFGLFALIGAGCSGSTEPAKVTDVSLSAVSVSLDAIGATQALVPTVRDQHDKVMNGVSGISWSTLAPAVATVSSAGVVTAVANGSTSVSATLDGVTATIPVTVLQVPVSPVAVAGNFQVGTVAQQLVTTLQVRTEDRLGNVMPNLSVTFAVTSGGGSLGTTTTTSDGAGLASSTWTLGGSTVPLQRVTVTVAGVVSGTVFSATANAGPAVAMNIAPGNDANGQTGVAGQAATIKPAVELIDALGNGVANAAVQFSIITGGGSVTGGNAVTNATGVATVGSWILGPNVGVNSVQASAGALTPVIFTAQAVTDPCQPAGASTITLGVTKNGSLANTDCQLPVHRYFDLYRLDLANQTSLLLEMTAANMLVLDTYLEVLDFNTQAVIAENDDIELGVIQNSRISTTLAAGSYLIRARSYDTAQVGSYTLLARTALLGVATNVVLNSGNGQVSAPGAPTGIAPSVKVTDEAGTPVAGVSVTFATVPGVGGVTGASAVTAANGVATVGSWSLAAGTNVLSATVNTGGITGNPVIFSGTGKASTAGFDIGLRFVAMPTLSQLQTFSDAATRWETIITGDIGVQPLVVPAGTCNTPSPIDESVDDVIIVVRLEPIDGVGQILGSAGPCFIRPSGFSPGSQASLTVMGTMRFDTADLANLELAGSFGNVITHEMGHVLGIGTLWSTKGFLVSPSAALVTNDTHFSGTAGVAGFNAIGGANYLSGIKVPVENIPDDTVRHINYAGTRNSHWREQVLGTELMTGFLNGGVANPLSQLTVGSLQDLGYTVNLAAADFFFQTMNLVSPGGIQITAAKPGIPMFRDVREGPVYTVGRDGRPVGMPRAPAPAVKKKPPPR